MLYIYIYIYTHDNNNNYYVSQRPVSKIQVYVSGTALRIAPRAKREAGNTIKRA